MNKSIKITFITPCFCRGADCSETGEPEIRPASIRGQLHWWFRAVGGMPQEENAIFGNVHDGGIASKVVIRVKYSQSPSVTSATLPHKQGGFAALKRAIAPNETVELLISTRLGGLNDEFEKKFLLALNAWLHLGALGLRATRGGGNFSWDDQPRTPEAYLQAIASFKLKSAFLDEVFPNAEVARKVITDTLGDKAFGGSAPLGKIAGGRKTSPLRFRIVKFCDNDFRIIAVWDGRTAVTGNSDRDLKEAVQTLKHNGKRIGVLLNNAGW